MFDTAFVLLVVAALLVVVGFCQPLAAYLRLPPPVLLGVVGVALGGFPAISSWLGWSGRSDPLADIFVELPVSSENIHLRLPAAPGVRGRHRHRRAANIARRGPDPAARDRRDPDHDRGDRFGAVAARRRLPGGLSASRCRRCNDGSRRGHRDFPRCWRPSALDAPRRGRGIAQRRGGDFALRGPARDDRQRAGAGYRLGAQRVLSVLYRRRLAGVAGRPGAALGHPLGPRRPARRKRP